MAISWTDVDVTATINMPSPLGTVYVTGSSVTFTIPKVQAKATGSYMTPPFYLGLGQDYTYGSGWGDVGSGLELKNGSTTIKELRGHSSKSVAKNTYVDIAYSTSASVTLTTSNYFKSTNPTARTVTLNLVAPQYCIVSPYEPSTGSSLSCANPSAKTLSTITLMLDVPPTATVSAISYDTPYVYVGLTTASVTVSNVSAKYGGNITDVTLTIGEQSASISGNGTLSILLNASGTFTPVVTITDSRGQTKDYTLDPITVGTYSTPTVNFDAERTTNTGVLDDEGLYATMVTTLTFDPIAEAEAPSVTITDEDGNVVADADISITWYSSRASDGTLSGAVTWSTLASGSTVYGLVSIIGDFDTQKSYVISLTPQDSEGITGDAKTDTLQTAFYTVDFLAGGHGIAFGKPAVNVGFECGMDATFDETLTAQDMTAQEVQDFVDGVGGGTGAFADKVIEQGTSGSWTYRKWSSGKIEAWGSQSFGSLVGVVWTSPIYYTDQTVTIPSGIFSDTPTHAYATAIGNQWTVVGTIISSATSIVVRMTKPTSSSQTANVALYVVGQ